MAEELGLFEAMHTQRALRYIRPDPIPDALVRKVLEAGTRAPNGGNQQRWRFVVIKDPETKRWIQERYRNTPVPGHGVPRNEAEARTMARNDAAAKHLAEHLHEVAAGLPFFTKSLRPDEPPGRRGRDLRREVGPQMGARNVSRGPQLLVAAASGAVSRLMGLLMKPIPWVCQSYSFASQ